MNKQTNQHQFACYYAQLASIAPTLIIGHPAQLPDASLAHRIFSVLRMTSGDTIILFDQIMNITLELTMGTNKKQLSGMVKEIAHNRLNTPAITVLLPVLKRDALEEALYSCVELGANNVQLITTAKTHKLHGDEKQLHRLSAIIVAAAEQSKNFAMPMLKAPIPLPHALENLPDSSLRFFFHQDGKSLNTIMAPLQQAGTATTLVMLMGPEGDCTQEEQQLIHAHSFIAYCLAPTVLRSQQALTIGLGALRSLTLSDLPRVS